MFVCRMKHKQLSTNVSFWYFVLKHDANVVKNGGNLFPKQIKILSDWKEKYLEELGRLYW